GGGVPTPPPVDRDAVRRRAEAQLRLETARTELARMESRVRELERAAADAARIVGEAHQRAAGGRQAAGQGPAYLTRRQAKGQAAGGPGRGPKRLPRRLERPRG